MKQDNVDFEEDDFDLEEVNETYDVISQKPLKYGCFPTYSQEPDISSKLLDALLKAHHREINILKESHEREIKRLQEQAMSQFALINKKEK